MVLIITYHQKRTFLTNCFNFQLKFYKQEKLLILKFLFLADALIKRLISRSSLITKNMQLPLSLMYNNSDVTSELDQNYTEKHVVCRICGRLCSSKSSLLTHIRVHTGEKPFICDLCGKKFTQKATLQRHRHLHTGEKHFKCDHCSKRFYRKDKLYEHLNVHRFNTV